MNLDELKAYMYIVFPLLASTPTASQLVRFFCLETGIVVGIFPIKDMYNNNEKEKRRGPAYFHNVGSEPLRAITTGQILNLAAEKWPSRDAMISIHENKAITFLQAKEQAEQFGACLLKLGLKPGDRLALIGVNTIHWYVTMLAAVKAGIILVMINPAYRASELRNAIEQVKPKAIVTDHIFKTQNYPELLIEIAPSISTSKHGEPINCAKLPGLSFIIVATEEKLPGCYRLKDVLQLTNDKRAFYAAEEQVQPDDPAYILFSSGTTGIPKGAVLSHFGTVNNCHYYGKRFDFHKKPSSLCLQVPLFHVFGSCLGVLCGLDFGITLVLPGPIFKKELTIEALKKYKPNIIYGTSTMYIDICTELDDLLPDCPEVLKACKSVDIALCAGAVCPPAITKKISKMFPCSKVQFGYGMTEASPICFATKLDDSFELRITTVGFAADHLEVKIVDRKGQMVNFGTPGEAWFRSYANFLEYWENEKKTSKTKTVTGWLRSGDLMVLSEDGYGKIVGRLKDIIIRGGENIFPAEIEELLLKHPDVKDAQVFGVSHNRMVEEVAAAIILKKSSTLTEKILQEYCNGKISHFKIPKYIRFVEEFPLTLSGKVKKFVLREMLEKELRDDLLLA